VLRETELTEIVTRLQTVVTNREARCARLVANGDGADIITTGDGGPRLDYIHADHLGRPAFVTDTNGAVLWDGGITTPFGVSLATMGALTQNLMFPGQYRDAETGYDDNWHRTYDPTLGRYLSSDPIGLAGGLNRYAYVGGNPVSYVDPMGLNPGIDRRAAAIGEIGSERGRQARLRHIYRNCLNVNLPINPDDAEYRGWERQPDKRNIYHQYDVNSPGDRKLNVKWMSPDRRREVIFQHNGQADMSPQNAGTYNFGTNYLSHLILDILPYWVHDSGPPEPSDCECESIGL
jgi:RHS repeat-associated protein